MRTIALWMTVSVVAALSQGCTTYYGDARSRQATAEREDMLMLREDLQQVRGRLESLEMENQQLREEVEYTRRSASQGSEDRTQDTRRRLDDLDRRISTLEANRQKDRDAILDKVAETVTRLMKTSAPTASRTPSRRASSEYGYEHVVESGQTLSEISKAYGVTSSAIIEANDIKDPNRLRVGQKLFIPE